MDSSHTAMPIGILADSHGRNDLLLNAIETLKSLGAGRLIHLGDLCDSFSPHLLGDALSILAAHGISGVRGNNECIILHDALSARSPDARARLVQLIEELPYTIRLGGFWFTHSAPLGYPAATKRPVSEFLPLLMDQTAFPFSILFRGHSHKPSILEIRGEEILKLSVSSGNETLLDRDRRYVITAGAVESCASLLFDPIEYSVRFVRVPGQDTPAPS